jgi:spore coat protein U-like protein
MMTIRGFARIAIFAVLVVAALQSSAKATTATSNFTVSASVISSCTISAANLAFGNYDPVVANATTALNVNSTITVACTKGDAVTIGLNAGLYGSHATGTTRAMSSGGTTPSYLSYDIYQNTGLTTLWGNSGSGLYNYTSTGKAAVALTDYGTVPAGQDQPIASYQDTVTATITF